MKLITYLCDKCKEDILPAESGWQYFILRGVEVPSLPGWDWKDARGHLCGECAKLSGMKLPKSEKESP